ncbi:MAG: VOC family protein [Gammaproteobacteria bacterium]
MEKVSRIFVNLPVESLQRSIDFFTALGFEFDRQFTDDTATCMIIGENMYAMLLVRPRFKDFIATTEISDSRSSNEVLVALQLDSREAVDSIVSKAVHAGGNSYRPPEDHGFMYGHAFSDPDGHKWEPFWMDPEALPHAG